MHPLADLLLCFQLLGRLCGAVPPGYVSEADVARQWVSTAVVDGIIYVIGGGVGVGEDWKVTSAVEAYDPVADQWISKADLPFPVICSAATVDRKIYVMGCDDRPGFTCICIDLNNTVYLMPTLVIFKSKCFTAFSPFKSTGIKWVGIEFITDVNLFF